MGSNNNQQQQLLDTGTGDADILFTSTQQIVRTFIPIFSGTLSVIGSITLLYIIISETKDQPPEQRRRRQSVNFDYSSDDVETRTSRCIDGRRVLRMAQMRRLPSNDSNTSNLPQQNQRRNPLSMFQRLMVGVAVSSLLVGIRATTSTFLLPSDTVGVWKAFGNTRTCTMQGFLTQFSALSSMLYSASLAIYFNFSIVPYKNARTILKRIEPVLHTGIILFATSTAFAGIFLDLYHPTTLGVSCWIAQAPCPTDEDTNVECAGQQNHEALRLCFAGVPVGLCFATILYCMTAIYFSVRKQKRKMQIRYDFTANTSVVGNNPTTLDRSQLTGRRVAPDTHVKMRLQKVSTQATLYISVFFIVHVWQVVGRRMEINNNIDSKFYVSVLSLLLYPMQGFFNFLIYIRPKFMQIRASDPNLPFLTAVKVVLRINRIESNDEALGPSHSQRITSSCRTKGNNTIAEESSLVSTSNGIDQRDKLIGLWNSSQRDLSNSSNSSQNEIIVFDNTILKDDKQTNMAVEERQKTGMIVSNDMVITSND